MRSIENFSSGVILTVRLQQIFLTVTRLRINYIGNIIKLIGMDYMCVRPLYLPFLNTVVIRNVLIL